MGLWVWRFRRSLTSLEREWNMVARGDRVRREPRGCGHLGIHVEGEELEERGLCQGGSSRCMLGRGRS